MRVDFSSFYLASPLTIDITEIKNIGTVILSSTLLVGSLKVFWMHIDSLVHCLACSITITAFKFHNCDFEIYFGK